MLQRSKVKIYGKSHLGISIQTTLAWWHVVKKDNPADARGSVMPCLGRQSVIVSIVSSESSVFLRQSSSTLLFSANTCRNQEQHGISMDIIWNHRILTQFGQLIHQIAIRGTCKVPAQEIPGRLHNDHNFAKMSGTFMCSACSTFKVSWRCQPCTNSGRISKSLKVS